MKKIYSEPTLKVVELDLKDGLLDGIVSTEQGELGGNGENGDDDEEGVKGFTQSLWDSIW